MNILFIFRRDLRIYDNLCLEEIRQRYKKEKYNIYTCFIFDPRQIADTNKYKSNKCLEFMNNCLKHLSKEIPMLFFYGLPEKVLEGIFNKIDIDLVAYNKDYTPFSKKRDKAINSICRKYNKEVIDCDNDVFLTTVETKEYRVFTPYYKHSKNIEIHAYDSHKIKPNIKAWKCKDSVKLSILKEYYKKSKKIIRADREYVLKRLKLPFMRKYHLTRDVMNDSLNSKSTSRISQHMKFGVISPREIYIFSITQKLPEEFKRQLYWRDFYLQLLHHNPEILKEPLYKKYKVVKWRNDKREFKLWKAGKTGFPIVDANMRCMNKTGFMPNRGRMIVAMFLTKILQIHWKWGEKYFATKLVDYDVANNNGGWQWSASTGADGAPYFRIMSPWAQQKKHDKHCEFIKRWIPELIEVDEKTIHLWEEIHKDNKSKVDLKKINYPAPIVDYSKRRAETIKIFKKVFKK